MLSTDIFKEKWIDPKCNSSNSLQRCVAIIGSVKFVFLQISYFMFKSSKKFLHAIYDIDKSIRSMKSPSYLNVYLGFNCQKSKLFQTAAGFFRSRKRANYD